VGFFLTEKENLIGKEDDSPRSRVVRAISEQKKSPVLNTSDLNQGIHPSNLVQNER
jgi:hypothetical protein